MRTILDIISAIVYITISLLIVVVLGAIFLIFALKVLIQEVIKYFIRKLK
jgi:hypothetical protein